VGTLVLGFAIDAFVGFFLGFLPNYKLTKACGEFVACKEATYDSPCCVTEYLCVFGITEFVGGFVSKNSLRVQEISSLDA